MNGPHSRFQPAGQGGGPPQWPAHPPAPPVAPSVVQPAGQPWGPGQQWTEPQQWGEGQQWGEPQHGTEPQHWAEEQQWGEGRQMPPQHAVPGPAPRSRQSGAMVWWLGLLGIFGVPIFSNIVGTVIALILHLAPTGWSVQAQQNARRALNWQLSLFFYTFVLLAAHFLVLYIVRESSSFYPVGIPLTLLGVLGLYHLVGSIVCAVMATDRAVGMPGALPFVWRIKADR